MSVNLGSGSTTITAQVNGNVPIPNSLQTLVNINGTGNGASQDAYTVAAGKTLYLFGAGVANLSTTINVYLNNATTLVFSLTSDASSVPPPFIAGCPLAVYAAGEIVKVTATNTRAYYLVGVLV